MNAHARVVMLVLLLGAALGCQPPPSGLSGNPSPKAVQLFKQAGKARDTDKTKAIELYTQVISKAPALEEAYFNRALTYSELARDTEAKADEAQLVELKSPLADKLRGLFLAVAGANVSLGEAAAESGDNGKAAEHFDRAMIYAPDDRAILVPIGMAYCALGNYERGMELLERTLHNEPFHEQRAEVMNVLAWHYATCSDDSVRNGVRAVELARRAHELAPQEFLYLDTLAAGHAEHKNFDEAITFQTRAVELAAPEQAAAARARLELYQQRQPYRDTARAER